MSTNAVKTIRKGVEKAKGVEPGTIVRFDRHFTTPEAEIRRIPEKITYAAIFVAGKWFFTGRGNLGTTTSTNAEFLEMLASDNISNVQVAVEFEEV